MFVGEEDVRRDVKVGGPKMEELSSIGSENFFPLQVSSC
jgi:hypothetical protein